MSKRKTEGITEPQARTLRAICQILDSTGLPPTVKQTLDRQILLAQRATEQVRDLLRQFFNVLAEFLADKSDELRDLAVDAVVKFAAMWALSKAMAAAGAKIGGMGADEMVEGLARLAVAEAVAQRSDELALAGLGYAVSGIEELEAAAAADELASEMAVEGVAEVAAGSMEIGAGETMEAVGERLAERAE